MRTIAVVEDDPSILRGSPIAFCPHTVSVFRPLRRAESFLEDIAKCEADLLLLDIRLAGISGIDLQRRYHATFCPSFL